MGGGLKSVQEPVPLFPKRQIFKSSKITIFKAFPAEVGGGHLFAKKAYVKGRTLLEGHKTDNCFLGILETSF